MRVLVLCSFALLVACAPQNPPLPAPPVAETREYAVTAPHGATRNDEYYWLRDDARENPEMLAYLKTRTRTPCSSRSPSGSRRCTTSSSAA